MDDARRADHVQALRWPGVRRACPALAVTLIAGTSVYAAVAVAQDAPNLNRIWAGCVLTDTAVTELEASVGEGAGIDTPEVAFVVVYSLNNDNDGQPVTVQGQAGFTGPVICRNTDVVSAPVATSQTDNVGPVTILDAEEAFVLRVQSGSSIAKRVCHTVNNNTDCFRISP
jgi:hypothetical protein